MKRIFFLLPLLVVVFFLGACESEAPMAPEIPKIPELNVHLGVTNDNDYVPFGSVTIPMVAGGSGKFSYELYRQGELIGNEPIEALRFDEPGFSLIELKVNDLQTGETVSASTRVVAQSALLGAPLEATLYIPSVWGFAPFTFSALGIARGGTLPYSYEMLIDGELVVPEDVLRWQINELGNHQILFRVTDAEGNIAEQFGDVLVTERQPEPVMQIAFNALPSTVKVGQKVGLITNVYGGQPPYQFEISVDSQVISTEPTALYQVNEPGEQMAEVKVTDATGMSSETVARFIGEEPYEYIHPITVDVSAGSYEEQLGEPIAFHADVDGLDGIFGEYVIEWHYILDENVIFGTGEDLSFAFSELGIYDVMAILLKDGQAVATDVVRVLITPADVSENARVDVSASPHEFQLGESSSLHADVHNIIEEYVLEWYEVSTGNFLGYSNQVTYTPTTQGQHQVECQVIIDDWHRVSGFGQVTVTPADQPESPTVDVTATPWNSPVPFYTTLHADVRGGKPPYEIVWYDEQGNSIGETENLYRLVEELGERDFKVRVTDSRGMTAYDIVVVTGESPDFPIPMTVTASAAVVHGIVPRWTSVTAHVQGGVGLIDYVWYKDDSIIGQDQSINYNMVSVGPDTLAVFATDEIGQWDTAMVILTGEVSESEYIDIVIDVDTWVGQRLSDPHQVELMSKIVLPANSKIEVSAFFEYSEEGANQDDESAAVGIIDLFGGEHWAFLEGSDCPVFLDQGHADASGIYYLGDINSGVQEGSVVLRTGADFDCHNSVKVVKCDNPNSLHCKQLILRVWLIQ